MPQRVIVVYSCSLCGSEFDAAESVTAYKISGGGRVLDLDVCAACEAGHKGFVSVTQAGITDRSVKAVGRVPAVVESVAAAPSGSVACEYCDGWFAPRGMALHLSRSHNVKTKTAAVKEGRGHGPLRCPECGFGAAVAQGLAAHRRSVHGVAGQNGARR